MAEKKKLPEIRFNGFEGEWEEKKLKQISSNISDGDWIEANHIFDEGEYRIIQTGNLGIGEYLDKSGHAKYFHQRDFNEIRANELFPGDILISRLAEPAGRTIVLPNTGFRMVTAVDVTIVRPESKKFDSHFFMTGMNRDETLKSVSESVAGTSHKRISRKNLENVCLHIPTLSEQTQIGTYFQNLDSLISLHQRKYDKLLTVKKAMLEKMFPREGADVPEIRFKDFEGKWEKKKLGEIFEIGSAARVHKNEWTESGVPFFRTSDVVAYYKGSENNKAYISFELFEELSKISGCLQKNDLLVTGGGSIGIAYLVNTNDPLYFKDGDLLWLKNSNIINGYFLYTFFSTLFFRSYVNSITHIGTISHYTIEQAKSTPFYVPEKEEQTKIGSFFQNLDTLITQHQKELEKLKNLKKACLEKMFV